jgi:beta-fructofuranosidase
MLKIPDHHLGDSWFFIEGKTAHAFYLICPDTFPRHAVWDIGHATSQNLIDWEIHPHALLKGTAGEWDHDCLATGSVIKRDGCYWMSYTSHLEATTGLAVSENLFDWKKCPANPLTQIDAQYYEEIGTGVRKMKHWRDPSLLAWSEKVYQFVCASNKTGPAIARGTVGVATSTDMKSWDVQPPLICAPIASELECPIIIPRDGRFYLVFSTLSQFFTPQALGHYFGGTATPNSTFCMVADQLAGPYSFRSEFQIIPRTRKEQPYACQIVRFQARDYLIGTVWNDDLDYLCDPIPVEFSDQGIRSMEHATA